MGKQGYMRTCNRCGGIDIEGKIYHTDDCLIGKAEKLEIAEGLLIVAELALEKLRIENAKRLELLMLMPEWSWDFDNDGYYCWICGVNKDYGHADDCELAEELGDALGSES